ncbi:hypothetical protein [Rheinheimera texasensis]|uniref:hypothetical protein n=1 Tax=Rheinheimera texasensis TaxID=306205 RepID=UPI0004E1249C|nr:hypothetical protein [Rheinheimera texasensis]
MSYRSRITFQGKEGLPAWAITHYLQQTEFNYQKFVLVERICALISDGLDPNSLVVATSSADVFPKKAIEYSDFDKFEIFVEKEDSAKKFWQAISRHHRPVVFYRDGDQYVLVNELNDENSLIIKNVAVNSPVSISLEGAVGAISDIYYASDREHRNITQWQNEQIGQTARNVEDIVRASSTANNLNVPEGVRAYANAILEQALRRQEKLNEEIGMTNARIDTQV